MQRFAISARLRVCLHGRRCMWYSTAPEDVRKRLTDELKLAMKSKDAFKSTTIRSILSEVYTADKVQPTPIPSTGIISILRKAIARRAESATEFDKASRPELAEKERKEADVLQLFVPPLLSEAEIDRKLSDIISELKPQPGDKRALGLIFKQFYSAVDRSAVDTDLVTGRAKALLDA